MRRSLFGGILVFGAVALMGAPVNAQETGTPVFSAPYRAYQNYSLGASFSDPGNYGDWALEGFYTFARGPHDFSVRAGMIDRGGDTDVLLGGEFRTRVVNYSQNFPFDGALTVGAGLQTGADDPIFLVPVGVSLGRRIQLENSNTTFTPYLHPVLVPAFGGGESDVGFALGLGVDMSLSQSWDIRVSGGIGDIEGVGISLGYAR
jgi:hypothetical protein